MYDEAAGDPDNGIAPGTKWEDLPADWVCPLCGAGKDEEVEQAWLKDVQRTRDVFAQSGIRCRKRHLRRSFGDPGRPSAAPRPE